MATKGDEYVVILKNSIASIYNQEYELKWSKNKAFWIVTSKTRYKESMEERVNEEKPLWWKVI